MIHNTHLQNMHRHRQKRGTFWSSFATYRFICLSDTNIPEGTLVKEEACTERMSTCLTVGAAQLALDLPVPVGGLGHDRAAGGRERICQPKCTLSNTSSYDGETKDQGTEGSCLKFSSCTGHESPKCYQMLAKIRKLV